MAKDERQYTPEELAEGRAEIMEGMRTSWLRLMQQIRNEGIPTEGISKEASEWYHVGFVHGLAFYQERVESMADEED